MKKRTTSRWLFMLVMYPVAAVIVLLVALCSIPGFIAGFVVRCTFGGFTVGDDFVKFIVSKTID